ncbi:hypothetical protein FQR65_LT16443 [Abscondita terminalis]|nr:hypothetical protein FQR65_LT16443 [Abscondita terminalis]
MNNFEEAHQNLQEALELTDTKDEPTHKGNAIGQSGLLQGRPSRYNKHYFSSMNAECRNILCIGECYEKLKDGRSSPILQKLVKLDNARYKLKQLDEAEKAYANVVELNPTDVEAWLDFSSIYFEQSKFVEAIDTIADAINHNPEAADCY